MKELFLEIKRIILDIDSPFVAGEKLFKTVKLDKGQFNRIINSQENTEFGYTFPAVFIHFVNVSYLVSQNRIGEGRGTMRVRFILNRLNDQDDEYETEIFDYAGIINAAIQDAKTTSTVLGEKCTLEYFDMPESSNMCQPCWLDYGVNFTDLSAEKYRDYIRKRITTPMFTNRSDVEGETRPDLGPEGYEDQAKIVDIIEE